MKGSKVSPNDEPSTAAVNDQSFAHYGVKFCYIQEFIDTVGGRDALKQLSTSKVKNLLLPLTANTKLSLCQQLYEEGRFDAVGKKADWFISHAWKYNFLEVFEAVEEFLVKTYGRPNIWDKVIWFDLFSNSQHKIADHDYSWWENIFASAVGEIGNVCMVMIPWDSPFTLTRAWCIFEVYSCVKTNSRFQVAMTQDQKKSFLDTMVSTKGDCFYDMLGKVKSEDSSAGRPSDKDNIHKAIRTHIRNGFIGLDSMVFRVMEKWMISVIEEIILGAQQTGDLLDAAKYELLLSMLLRKQATYDQAAIQNNILRAENVVSIRKNLLGSQDLLTVEAKIHLCQLYTDEKMYSAAETLLSECIEIYRLKKGSKHSDTLFAVSRLATIYCKDQKFDEAEALLFQCIKHSRNDLSQKTGSDSLEAKLIALSYEHNLANLYSEQGRLAEAETTYTKVMNEYAATLGADHHDTLVVKNNLSVLLTTTHRYHDAEHLLLDCLQGRERTLGKTHFDTMIAMHNLSCLYMNIEKFDAAFQLCTECLQLRKKALGDSHPETQNSMMHLSDILLHWGKLQECERQLLLNANSITDFGILYPQFHSLAILYDNSAEYKSAESILNYSIQQLSACYSSSDLKGIERKIEVFTQMGVHFNKLGDYEKAANSITQAVELSVATRGAEHKGSLALRLLLASILIRLGHGNQAEAIVLDCFGIRQQMFGETSTESLETLTVLESLAIVHEQKGEFQAAEAVLKKSLQIKLSLLGPTHTRTIEAIDRLCHMAATAADEGQKRFAERLFLEVIEDFKGSLGPNHCKTLEAMHALGMMYLHWKEKLPNSLNTLLQCLREREGLLSISHPDTAATMHAVGQAYLMLDNFDKAQSVLACCLDSKEQCLVPYHPDLVATLEALANAERLLNDLDSADKNYRRALALRSNYKQLTQNTTDAVDELDTLYYLGEVLKSKHQYEAALVIWEDCLQRRRLILGDHEADVVELEEELQELKKLAQPSSCCSVS